MIESQVIDSHTTFGDIGCIYIYQIIITRYRNCIEIQRPIHLTIAENRLIRFFYKSAEPILEGLIPCDFVPK